MRINTISENSFETPKSVVILFHATVKIYFSMTQQYFTYNSKLVSIYNMFIT